MSYEYPWMWYVLSYAIVCFGVHSIVKRTINMLWQRTMDDLRKKYPHEKFQSNRPNATVSFWYGVTERAIFASCFIITHPEGIAVWLAFKSLVRWKMSEEPDPRHIPGSSIYMIGTAMNIGFGFLGAVIAYRDFSFIIPH